MAIGVGSIVAVKVSSVQLALGNASAQPPAFGCNESASSPFTVTWASNGSRTASIPSTSLDEISNPSDGTLALLGQVVNLSSGGSPALGASPSLNSLVIGAYARSGVDVVLMKSLQTGSFMEALASAVKLQSV